MIELYYRPTPNGRLRRAGKFLTIDHREIDAAAGKRLVAAEEIRTCQRRVHHAPGKGAHRESGN